MTSTSLTSICEGSSPSGNGVVANPVVNTTAPAEVGFQVFLNGVYPNNDGNVVWNFGDGTVFQDVWTVTIGDGSVSYHDTYYYNGVETSNVGVSGVAGGGHAYDHIYTTAGDYNATWTLTIKDWGSQSTWWAVCVSKAPNHLVAAASANVKAYAGNASEWFYQSYATGGVPPYSYTWYFGDGATDTVTGLNVTHSYASPGLYQAFLKVTDSDDGTYWTNASAVKGVGGPDGPVGSLDVANVPECSSPCSVGYYTSLTGPAPLALSFTIDPHYVMVNTGFLGGTEYATPPYTFNWDFGDGSSATTGNATHTYAVPGVYCETLTMTDFAGRSGSWSLTIFVSQPHIITTATTSTTPTTSTEPASSTTSSGGSSGVPEFPVQLGFTLLVTVAIVASYVAARRVTLSRQ